MNIAPAITKILNIYERYLIYIVSYVHDFVLKGVVLAFFKEYPIIGDDSMNLAEFSTEFSQCTHPPPGATSGVAVCAPVCTQ